MADRRRKRKWPSRGQRERMVYEQGRTDGQTRKERSKKRSDGDKRKERWTEKEGAIEEIRKERWTDKEGWAATYKLWARTSYQKEISITCRHIERRKKDVIWNKTTPIFVFPAPPTQCVVHIAWQ
jgi:hypothetical protein